MTTENANEDETAQAEIASNKASQDWRARALCQTIEKSTARLMRDILAGSLNRSFLSLTCDRSQLLAFLFAECNAQSLLRGSFRYANNTHSLKGEYLGWYRVRWQGDTLEVVLLPGIAVDEPVLCVAESDAVLQAFQSALEEYLLRPEGRVLYYSEEWKPAPEMESEIGAVTWDDVVLPEETIAGIRRASEGFLSHRQSYETLGFPWRRGILLIGPPGTGKTMICKAMAAAMPQLPLLYVRDLRSSIDGDAIEEIFTRARSLAPCLLVFEDVDGLVSRYNRSRFLNELDGFKSNQGILTLASSNHPGEIDEALLKRPSRFDRVFHIGLPEEAERREYSRRLLCRLPEGVASGLDAAALAGRIAARSKGLTLAYLKEVFTGAALETALNVDPAVGERALSHISNSAENTSCEDAFNTGAFSADAFSRCVMEQIETQRAYLKKIKSAESLGQMKDESEAIGLVKR